MIEHIKQIGLFMIVTQTFIHVAAGKQYEKYVKIIAGVIVLLLFVRPFSSSEGDIIEQWQEEMERMTREMEQRSGTWQEELPAADYGMEKRVKQQVEEEIKTRLNKHMQSENYIITEVITEWETDGGESGEGGRQEAPAQVRITLAGKTQEREEVPIMIEKIQIGTETEQKGGEAGQTEEDGAETQAVQEYRKGFADILGMAQEQVEVRYSGSG